MAFSAVFIKKKNKIIQFSFWWFLISAGPVFFVMASFSSYKLCMAENWIYLAAIGFYVMMSYALYILWLRRKTAAYFLIAVLVLAYVCITSGNSAYFKDRISLAGHILRYDPENEEAHKELANAYCEKKEYGEALAHIEEAARLDPLDPDLFILKGTYYEDTGNIDLAVTMYETLLRIQPFSARAHNNLGSVYFNQGKLDKAKVFFERAIELNPLLAEPYLNMAKLYQRHQKTAEAAGFYLQAIKNNPGLKEGFLNLARMYLEQNNFKGAIDILNKAWRFGHRGGDVLLALGIANGALGFDVLAERYFKEALKGEPRSEEITLNLGIFYANRGQLNKAIAMWQEGLHSNPGSKALKTHIEKARELLSQ
jgi:tetratricopeptide (TPR) repeat protein